MKKILFLVFLISSNCLLSQVKDDIDKFVLKQLEDQKITGISIGVIKNGKVIKTTGYGMANLEQNIPATENSVFKLASVSKQFISTAIMKLKEDGKLKLTDTIGMYFKDAPANWNKITIRHLLNHSSGLERESPAFDFFEIKADSVLIRAAYKDPLVFATGTKWQYCNLGYFMLADIIRIVSGVPFPKFMREEIFIKNGMSNTNTTSASNLVPLRAGGYVRAGHDSIMNAQDGIALRPSGAFISTITDLMKWEILMQENRFLSQGDWQKMWTDTVSTGSKDLTEYYGYGWTTRQYKNKQIVLHTGSLPGFRTIFFRCPADKTAIIVLTNSDHANPTTIAQGVADILYKDK